MKRVACLALVWLLVPILGSAHGGVDAARRSVEASMLVTGEIAVNPDGSVYGYSLDHRDKLPAPIVKLIGDTLPCWTFTPVKVDGKAVLAKALMSLRIVAYQDKPKHFVASIEGAEFGDDAALYENSCPPGACLTYATRRPPGYPFAMVREGVSGTVYVEVEVNRQGRVADAAIRQIDLRKLGDETELARWRHSFAQATLDVVRSWTFNVPTTGNGAKQSQWFVTIPINYSFAVMGEGNALSYGQWDAYVPGPVQPMPWAKSSVHNTVANGSGDAIPDNGKPFVTDSRFVLLTPIGGDDAAKPSPETTPGQG